MAKYDVIIVGAGAAGLSAGALLAKIGKKVLVLEKDQYIGGRGMTVPFEGYRLNLGGHLMEDSGSGLTKIMEFVGQTHEHGPINSAMPVYHEGKWKRVQELYQADKGELKKVIKILCETDWDELDKYDDIPLRTWLQKYTSSEGVFALFEYLALLECLTEDWWDHAASDNLFVRKLHYQEKHIAGYSYWPVGGFDGMFGKLATAIREHGGEVRLQAAVQKVVIEKGQVKGIMVEQVRAKATPNEYPDLEFEEAPCVIVTAPVWNVLDVVDEGYLPDWWTAKVKHIARDEFKVNWLGMYVATKEPMCVLDPNELTTWLNAPRSHLSGWAFLTTALDPSVAPPGVHLFNCGAAYQGTQSRDWVEQKYAQFEQDLAEMYPTFNKDNIIWKRRHLVSNPPFGVMQKPGLVGVHRPEDEVPTVDGLYFAGETYKSRGIGIDRAARSALTVVEKIIGYRIPEFKDSWHY